MAKDRGISKEMFTRLFYPDNSSMTAAGEIFLVNLYRKIKKIVQLWYSRIYPFLIYFLQNKRVGEQEERKEMASLSLKHINKTYPNGFEAVKDFNMEIEDKEFIIL